VLTNKEWRYHDDFPVLAVEVKPGDDHHISDALDGVQKIIALHGRPPKYSLDKKELSFPVFYLLATPPSVERGIVTMWGKFKDQGECCGQHTALVLNKFLNRYGAALLRKGSFEVAGNFNGKHHFKSINLRFQARPNYDLRRP
jgi:hypothetical protein